MTDSLDLSRADEVHKSKESYDLSSPKADSAESDEALINKNMLIGEVIEQYPELLDVFMENGLHCVGCAFSPFDTIDTGCKTHGWEDEKIDEFVAKLNEVVSPKSDLLEEDACCGGGCCGSSESKKADSCSCC